MEKSFLTQTKTAENIKQFLLIFRYDADMKTPDEAFLKSNVQDWGAFVGELIQSSKLVNSFRPSPDGRTITGTDKITQNSVYNKNGEIISSIFVINANTMEEASDIANKCPIYEMGGSVEIRPIVNMVN